MLMLLFLNVKIYYFALIKLIKTAISYFVIDHNLNLFKLHQI